MQHVIYQNDIPALYAELNICALGYLYIIALVYIIAVKGNVQFTVVNMFLSGDLLHQLRNTVAEQHSTGLNTNYYSIKNNKYKVYYFNSGLGVDFHPPILEKNNGIIELSNAYLIRNEISKELLDKILSL
jgi:hypothetical protein